MSYYIYELPDGRQIGEFRDDGKNEIVLITTKASVLTRKIIEPPIVDIVSNML